MIVLGKGRGQVPFLWASVYAVEMRLTWMILMFLAFAPHAWAQAEHKLLRRLAVFPVRAEKELSHQSDDTWWKVREILTEDRRFLVASKNFMTKKDVFQARGELSPADAIILGQLLDAQGLIVTYLEERVLHMKVYEGEYGRTLWEQQIELHPSLSIARQLEDAGKKLVNDFIASIPYQGFVIVDSLIGRPVYQQDGKTFVKMEVGSKAKVEIGDEVHLVRLTSDRLRPIFSEAAQIEVFAEGKVVEKSKEILVVEVQRATRLDQIGESSLVRLPNEFKRLRESQALRETLAKKVNPEYFSPEMTPLAQEAREFQPLVTALTFIGNLALFLVLAF